MNVISLNNISVKAEILAGDQDGRYIKGMLTYKNGKISRTFSCIYLEPNGDIDLINPSAIMADISAGDLKNAETGVAGKFHPPPPPLTKMELM